MLRHWWHRQISFLRGITRASNHRVLATHHLVSSRLFLSAWSEIFLRRAICRIQIFILSPVTAGTGSTTTFSFKESFRVRSRIDNFGTADLAITHANLLVRLGCEAEVRLLARDPPTLNLVGTLHYMIWCLGRLRPLARLHEIRSISLMIVARFCNANATASLNSRGPKCVHLLISLNGARAVSCVLMTNILMRLLALVMHEVMLWVLLVL